MGNFALGGRDGIKHVSKKSMGSLKRAFLALMLGLGLVGGTGVVALAREAREAPPALQNLIGEVESAANRRDLNEVMGYYSDRFANSDNLGRSQLADALKKLWEDYPTLTYYTELQSWQEQNNQLVAETITYITGTRQTNGREVKLKSTLRSRQYIEAGQILRQDILAERTQLSLGEKPPEVTVNLPEQVAPGQQFNFDVIVKDPLGNDLLLGGVLEEAISVDRYLNSGDFDLELLQAGGIFKQGRAPEKADNHWLSAILIRAEGITIVTQRLRVGR